MGQRIGNEPVAFVRKCEFSLDTPTLLGELSTSEEHIKHIKAIQVLSNLLNRVAMEAIRINDDDLLELMFRLKLLEVVEE